MSIPWIQVYSNLLQHPKTSALADALGLKSTDVSPNVCAAGLLVALWTWAAQSAYNGDLSKCSDRAIADACMYKKSPAKLVAALEETGWLDDGRKLHEWEQYAALYISAEAARRESNRKRVAKYRAQKGGGGASV